MDEKIKVTVCLGSSCFSRKNRDVVTALQEYITDKNLNNKVQLRGGHCFGHCKTGPIIIINDQEFSKITPQKAIVILESFLLEE